MFAALHQRCHGIGGFPCSDSHPPIADNRTNPTNEPGHGQHFHADLLAARAHRALLLLGAELKTSDAEGARNSVLPTENTRAGPEAKRTNGLGLNDDIESQGSQILTLQTLAPETIGIQGTIVIRSQGGTALITATGLRINPTNSFTPLRAFVEGR
jgi:hypothetical protein